MDKEYDKYQPKNRNCGYCGKTFQCTEGQLMLHVHGCEVNCVNRNYGETSGDHA